MTCLPLLLIFLLICPCSLEIFDRYTPLAPGGLDSISPHELRHHNGHDCYRITS